MVWYVVEWYGMVWYEVEWYGMRWNGMVWYGMRWNGMWHPGMGYVEERHHFDFDSSSPNRQQENPNYARPSTPPTASLRF